MLIYIIFEDSLKGLPTKIIIDSCSKVSLFFPYSCFYSVCKAKLVEGAKLYIL